MTRFRILLALAVSGWITGSARGQNPPSPPARDCMEGMAMPGCPAPGTPPGTPAGGAAGQAPGRQEESLPPPELLRDVAARHAMTLADFEALAEHHNPTLGEAGALVRRSEGQARQAGLSPNPSVGYQGEQIRGGSFGGGEQGGFIGQTVVLGGKLGLRRDIYEQQAKADRIGLEEQTRRVHGGLERRFYAALAAQQEVRVRQRLLAVARDAVETAHQLSNVGQADAPDILQTEVEAEEAAVDYETAQRSYLAAFGELASVAGSPELPPGPLEGDLERLPELDAGAIVDRMADQSPAVRRAEQEVAVARSELRDAGREAVPDLQLRAGLQSNGEQVAIDPPRSAGAQGFATAGVDIPFWNRNQGNVQAARAEVERAEQAVLRERLGVRRSLGTIAQSYLSARSEAERYRSRLLPLAERAHQLYLARYREMAQAYPQVLVSQRTLFQLEVDYVHALRRAWQAATALENGILAEDVDEGLDAPVGGGSRSTRAPSNGINLPGGGGGQERGGSE